LFLQQLFSMFARRNLGRIVVLDIVSRLMWPIDLTVWRRMFPDALGQWCPSWLRFASPAGREEMVITAMRTARAKWKFWF